MWPDWPLERDIVERFTNTVVVFDIDETVSMGICLLAKALYYTNNVV